jgi:hypothetical protein
MSFIDALLDKMEPFGPNAKNCVLIMDNCKIHKSELLREMVEERCVQLSLLSSLELLM